jgi:hypothetical protein
MARFTCGLSRSAALIAVLTAVVGCGGGGGGGGGNSNTNGGGTTYTVGGTVSGLTGSGFALLNTHGGNSEGLPVTANGSFHFSISVGNGAPYSVTVETQPVGQTCTVANGSGTISGANVTNVAVTCVDSGGPTYTVGGAVSGLTGTGLILRNGNFGGLGASYDYLTVSGNGNFTFAAPLLNGSPYWIDISNEPVGQTCTVTNAGGTISGANVTNVVVTCVASGGGVCGGGSITTQASCDYRSACSARGQDCACVDYAQASALTLDAMKTSCTTPDQSGLVGVWSTSPCPTAGRVGTCIFDAGNNLDVNRYYTAAAAAGDGSWCPASGGCWIPN